MVTACNGMFDLMYQAVYTLTDCLLTPTKLYYAIFCSQLSLAGTSGDLIISSHDLTELGSPGL